MSVKPEKAHSSPEVASSVNAFSMSGASNQTNMKGAYAKRAVRRKTYSKSMGAMGRFLRIFGMK
jgi:hypothetical protein